MDQLLVSGGGGITEKNKVPKITASCKSNVLSPTVQKKTTHTGDCITCVHTISGAANTNLRRPPCIFTSGQGIFIGVQVYRYTMIGAFLVAYRILSTHVWDLFLISLIFLGIRKIVSAKVRRVWIGRCKIVQSRATMTFNIPHNIPQDVKKKNWTGCDPWDQHCVPE